MLCDQFGWNHPSGYGEEDVKWNVFSLFCLYLPLKNACPFIKTYIVTFIHSTKYAFMPSLIEVGPVVLVIQIFKSCWCILTILKWSYLHPQKIISTKFDSNWPSGSGDLKNLSDVNETDGTGTYLSWCWWDWLGRELLSHPRAWTPQSVTPACSADPGGWRCWPLGARSDSGCWCWGAARCWWCWCWQCSAVDFQSCYLGLQIITGT